MGGQSSPGSLHVGQTFSYASLQMPHVSSGSLVTLHRQLVTRRAPVMVTLMGGFCFGIRGGAEMRFCPVATVQLPVPLATATATGSASGCHWQWQWHYSHAIVALPLTRSGTVAHCHSDSGLASGCQWQWPRALPLSVSSAPVSPRVHVTTSLLESTQTPGTDLLVESPLVALDSASRGSTTPQQPTTATGAKERRTYGVNAIDYGLTGNTGTKTLSHCNFAAKWSRWWFPYNNRGSKNKYLCCMWLYFAYFPK